MLAPENPPRWLLIADGIILVVAAIALGVLAIAGAPRKDILVVAAGLCLAFGVVLLRNAHGTTGEEVDLADLPPRAAFFRRYLVFSYVVMPAASLFLGTLFFLLESGIVSETEAKKVPANAILRGLVYAHDYAGFWPCALIAPALGVACAWYYAAQVRYLRKQDVNQVN